MSTTGAAFFFFSTTGGTYAAAASSCVSTGMSGSVWMPKTSDSRSLAALAVSR